ncbi:MAG: hypothetical protein LH629_05785, partial [Ignavibacteria bacterium]|nr:hypothetical protein [Ignavibacteria bacterium]
DYRKYFLKYSKEITGVRGSVESENLDKSLYYIEKCIIKDSKLSVKKLSLKEALDVAKSDGAVCGVYKLYSAGKYFFQKYWYMSGYGENENIESNEARVYAENYLRAALKFPWTDNFKKQSKAFIAERLGRLLITKNDKNEYEKAIEIMKPFINERTGYYIRYTYATALYKAGKTDEAAKQIKASMINIKQNKQVWLGNFMLSCIEIKNGNMEEAGKILKKVIEESNKNGVKNTDSLYVAEAFIKYKSGDRVSALGALEMAMKINPYKKVYKERYDKWSKGEIDFDLLEI